MTKSPSMKVMLLAATALVCMAWLSTSATETKGSAKYRLKRSVQSGTANSRTGHMTGSRSGLVMRWATVSAGATLASSSSYDAAGTTGQSAVGYTGSDSYGAGQGYWSEPEPSGYLCGDADGNDLVNISDAVYLIAYIFGGGPAPDPLAGGDADCNSLVNISDAVYLIAYIFGGGPAPCANCP